MENISERPGKMQENLELSLLKNILIIIRVVRWEVVVAPGLVGGWEVEAAL